MAQLFKHEDGCHYGSIPNLPLVLKSHAICVKKSIGYVAVDYKYATRIGRVVRIIEPGNDYHKWWEVQKADGYVTPKPTDTIVIVLFPEVGEEMFLPTDLVHVTPVSIN